MSTNTRKVALTIGEGNKFEYTSVSVHQKNQISPQNSLCHYCPSFPCFHAIACYSTKPKYNNNLHSRPSMCYIHLPQRYQVYITRYALIPTCHAPGSDTGHVAQYCRLLRKRRVTFYVLILGKTRKTFSRKYPGNIQTNSH
jgi:hypothetical protein